MYQQCQYELMCVPDVTRWACRVTPPPSRPRPTLGQCQALYAAVEELRWQVQTSEKARTDTGSLPSRARKALKAALARLEHLGSEPLRGPGLVVR